MIKNLWALRYVLAMLLAFTLAITGLVWAVRGHPFYLAAGVVALTWLVFLNGPSVRRKQALTKARVHDAFKRSYALLSIQPKLVESTSYGFPHFEVSFCSKQAMESAAAYCTAFKSEIAAIFKGTGPWGRPFDADLAVSFTYDGYLEELRASFQTEWQKKAPEQVNPERIV